MSCACSARRATLDARDGGQAPNSQKCNPFNLQSWTSTTRSSIPKTTDKTRTRRVLNNDRAAPATPLRAQEAKSLRNSSATMRARELRAMRMAEISLLMSSMKVMMKSTSLPFHIFSRCVCVMRNEML